jgi:hypothetical protein
MSWIKRSRPSTRKGSPDEQSDIGGFLHLDPAYRCAHAGYVLAE